MVLHAIKENIRCAKAFPSQTGRSFIMEPSHHEGPREWQIVCYNEFSLCQGSFPYTLLLEG